MHFNEKILSCQFCPKRFAKCLAIPNNLNVNVKYISRLNLLLLYMISIVCCCRDFIKQISKMLVNIHAMEYAVNLPMWAVNQTEVRINLQIKQTQQTQQAHRVKSPCLESPLSLQGYIQISQVLVDLLKTSTEHTVIRLSISLRRSRAFIVSLKDLIQELQSHYTRPLL